jgi:hypothetical protein
VVTTDRRFTQFITGHSALDEPTPGHISIEYGIGREDVDRASGREDVDRASGREDVDRASGREDVDRASGPACVVLR